MLMLAAETVAGDFIAKVDNADAVLLDVRDLEKILYSSSDATSAPETWSACCCPP